MSDCKQQHKHTVECWTCSVHTAYVSCSLTFVCFQAVLDAELSQQAVLLVTNCWDSNLWCLLEPNPSHDKQVVQEVTFKVREKMSHSSVTWLYTNHLVYSLKWLIYWYTGKHTGMNGFYCAFYYKPHIHTLLLSHTHPSMDASATLICCSRTRWHADWIKENQPSIR